MSSLSLFVIMKLYFSDEEGEADEECIVTENSDDLESENADEEIASASQASLERDSCVSRGTVWHLNLFGMVQPKCNVTYFKLVSNVTLSKHKTYDCPL